MRSALVVSPVLASLLVLVGCGGGSSLPAYEQAEACAVDSATVTDVVGTEGIEVEERGTLPLGDADPAVATWACVVNVADRNDVVSVTAKLAAPEELAERTQAVETAPEQLEVAGGRAGIADQDGAFTAQWICGTTSLYVTAGPVEPASDDAVETLVEELAEAVGCPE